MRNNNRREMPKFKEPKLERKYQKVLRKGIFKELKKIKVPS